MSPVSLTLDLLLAVLLLITLIFGLKLDKRLKTLQASQADFAEAVADLDRAAARAETGLADLRTAMDEAVDLLAARIEKARELANRLEVLTAQGAAVAGPPAAPGHRSTLDRLWGKPARAEPASARPSAPVARAEPEAPPLTLTRNEAPPVRRPQPTAPSPRSRALVDDELFDGPGIRRSAGGRP
jgi:hypothetical protein